MRHDLCHNGQSNFGRIGRANIETDRSDNIGYRAHIWPLHFENIEPLCVGFATAQSTDKMGLRVERRLQYKYFEIMFMKQGDHSAMRVKSIAIKRRLMRHGLAVNAPGCQLRQRGGVGAMCENPIAETMR